MKSIVFKLLQKTSIIAICISFNLAWTSETNIHRPSKVIENFKSDFKKLLSQGDTKIRKKFERANLIKSLKNEASSILNQNQDSNRNEIFRANNEIRLSSLIDKAHTAEMTESEKTSNEIIKNVIYNFPNESKSYMEGNLLSNQFMNIIAQELDAFNKSNFNRIINYKDEVVKECKSLGLSSSDESLYIEIENKSKDIEKVYVKTHLDYKKMIDEKGLKMSGEALLNAVEISAPHTSKGDFSIFRNELRFENCQNLSRNKLEFRSKPFRKLRE